MFDFLTLTKALTDENRLRILMALRDRELCVCQITGFLDLAPSTTSRHLSILRQARLIDSRKKGKWVYYGLPSLPDAPVRIREAVDWITRSLQDLPVILEDENRIRDVLARGLDLCACERAPDTAADNFHSLAIHSLAEASGENASSL
ncbi:MAG: metalloregulator ArsR/SmtB family transcription factor [Desulfovibrio sp.]|jgi:ArsR family transcriptional regulator|nr:metalloregulator ArsR/SmtB family transcription factor [Desulfovibrio sp.]